MNTIGRTDLRLPFRFTSNPAGRLIRGKRECFFLARVGQQAVLKNLAAGVERNAKVERDVGFEPFKLVFEKGFSLVTNFCHHVGAAGCLD